MSNSIIKSALLSYGMSGRVFHAPFIDLHPGFSLAGAWERSNKNIEKDYPGVKSYASIDEILADPTIDLVVVNTPIYSHYEYALAALNADKHIIVEKAFTTNLQEALAIANQFQYEQPPFTALNTTHLLTQLKQLFL